MSSSLGSGEENPQEFVSVKVSCTIHRSRTFGILLFPLLLTTYIEGQPGAGGTQEAGGVPVNISMEPVEAIRIGTMLFV